MFVHYKLHYFYRIITVSSDCYFINIALNFALKCVLYNTMKGQCAIIKCLYIIIKMWSIT